MVYVVKHDKACYAYIYEAYRRMYAEAINHNGNFGDFDVLMSLHKINNNGCIQYMIPYEDWYLNSDRQTAIIDEVCKEPYKIIGRDKKHKLTEQQKKSVRFNATMGCSPFCCTARFVDKYPNLNKILAEDLRKEREEELKIHRSQSIND